MEEAQLRRGSVILKRILETEHETEEGQVKGGCMIELRETPTAVCICKKFRNNWSAAHPWLLTRPLPPSMLRPVSRHELEKCGKNHLRQNMQMSMPLTIAARCDLVHSKHFCVSAFPSPLARLCKLGTRTQLSGPFRSKLPERFFMGNAILYVHFPCTAWLHQGACN
eukprot:355754-Chlamydomonas_euryale.AAC.15